MTNLNDYGSCLSDTILYYDGLHLPDHPYQHKCDGEGFKNVSVKYPNNKLKIYRDICGACTDVCFEFQKGKHKFIKPLKLTEVPECEEESSLGSNIEVVIGIIIGVGIIFLLFFCLFRYGPTTIQTIHF